MWGICCGCDVFRFFKFVIDVVVVLFWFCWFVVCCGCGCVLVGVCGLVCVLLCVLFCCGLMLRVVCLRC